MTQEQQAESSILPQRVGYEVHNITVCHLPYQSSPFVHGWIQTDNGKRDVWLRNDGSWTTEEGDSRNSLKLSDTWETPDPSKITNSTPNL